MVSVIDSHMVNGILTPFEILRPCVYLSVGERKQTYFGAGDSALDSGKLPPSSCVVLVVSPDSICDGIPGQVMIRAKEVRTLKAPGTWQPCVSPAI